MRLLDSHFTGAAAERSKKRADENVQDLADHSRVVREAVADRVRKRQHPLPHRRLREDTVDQMSGGIGHAASPARRTETPPLTRKGDGLIVPAVVAMNTNEAVGQDSTFQKGPQLALDEAGNRTAALFLPDQKRLQMSGDRPVEQTLRRFARAVFGCGAHDRRVCNRARRTGVCKFSRLRRAARGKSGSSAITAPRLSRF